MLQLPGIGLRKYTTLVSKTSTWSDENGKYTREKINILSTVIIRSNVLSVVRDSYINKCRMN